MIDKYIILNTFEKALDGGLVQQVIEATINLQPMSILWICRSQYIILKVFEKNFFFLVVIKMDFKFGISC